MAKEVAGGLIGKTVGPAISEACRLIEERDSLRPFEEEWASLLLTLPVKFLFSG